MDSNHQSRSGKGLAFFETTLIDLRPLHLRGKQLTSTAAPLRRLSRASSRATARASGRGSGRNPGAHPGQIG